MHGTSKFVKLFSIFGVKKWTKRLGAEDGERMSDVHVATRVFSVVLKVILPLISIWEDWHFLKCCIHRYIFRVTLIKPKKKGGETKKRKRKTSRKKIRPSQTRSISIITYDIHKWWKFSKFCFNLNRTRYAGARGTTTNKIRDSFKFFESEQETNSFISISCYWYIRWCSEEQ